MLRFESQSFYDAGNNYYKKKEYQKAVEQFSLAITDNKNDNMSRVLRAKSYFYLNEFDRASLDCRDAIQLNADDDEAHHLLGRIAFARKMYHQAVDSYTCAITLLQKKNVRQHIYYVNRSLANKHKGCGENAIADLEMALAVKSADAKIHLDLSLLYQRAGDAARAFNYLLNAMVVELKVTKSVTNELIEKYKRHLACYKAEDVFDSLSRELFTESNSMIDSRESRIKLIKKYCPDDYLNAGYYFQLGIAFSANPFFKQRAIDMFLKTILIELNAGKAFEGDLIVEAIKRLKEFEPDQILIGIDNLSHTEALLVLKKCLDANTLLGQHCPKEYIDGIVHEINYKEFMDQPESVRMSKCRVGALFESKLPNNAEGQVDSGPRLTSTKIL